MDDILYCKNLFDPIDIKGVKLEEVKDEDWIKMNQKTVGCIRQWIDHSVFHHVTQETDAYVLWTMLEGMYQSKTTQNNALVMRRLVNLKLKNGVFVTKHNSEFKNLVNQLATVKMPLDDEMQAVLLLSSLPDNWETLVVSLSNSTPEGKLTMSMVTNAMHNEVTRRKDMRGNQSHALVTEDRGRDRDSGRGRGRNKSRGRWNNMSKSRNSKYQGNSSFTCFHCGQEGHIKRNCPSRKDKG